MKGLIISGSPNKGYTWKAVEYAIKRFQQLERFEFEEVILQNKEIPFCKGCFSCFSNGEETCPHSSKVLPIVEKIKESDVLIITSPVYALNISAVLKNFFDHTAYLYHRPNMFTKKAIVITSTAGGGSKKISKYISENLKFWGFNKVYRLSFASMGNKDIPNKSKIKCNKIVNKTFNDIKLKKIYSQSIKYVMFYNLWRGLTSLDTALKSDKNYWIETGLNKYTYSPNVPIGFFKRTFGNIIFLFFRKKFN